MILLTAEKINKNYGGRQILSNISLTIDEGDKIGVIGINGTGKSTLLKIIAGTEPSDNGIVSKINGIQIGYLPQNPVFVENTSVMQQVVLHAEVSQTSSQEYEYKTLLTKLGIVDFNQNVNELSGGQKKRVALAAALASKVDLLILDEPTNHIDSEMVVWLESYLARFRGALLMVTHDRYFLERVSNRMIELQDGNLYSYPANYSKYLELKAERESMLAASERKRQTLLKNELEWIRRGARARGTKARFRVERFEELNNQSGLNERDQLEMSSISSRLGKKIIEIESISKSYDNKILFHDFNYFFLREDRIGVVGSNGCGKSTFLKTILGVVSPDCGSVTIGSTVNIGYFSQESEELNLSMRVIDSVKEISSEVVTSDGTFTASQMLERFLFPPELQYAEIGRLSGGERRRLFLLQILMTAPNILFLDEPTNDLDIETLTILEDYLDCFSGAVIAVSHDRYFLDRIADHIFAFEKNGMIKDYLGGYSDYLQQKQLEEKEMIPANEIVKKEPPKKSKNEKLKFSFKEQREYEEIDNVIETLELEIEKLNLKIEEQASDYSILPNLLAQKEELENSLVIKMERWVYLNDLAEKIKIQNKGILQKS